MDPRNHIFKAAGAAAGLILGLGIFGLISGLIGGALVDQLLTGLRRKKKLRAFFENPESASQAALQSQSGAIFQFNANPLSSAALTEAAAAAAVWRECLKEPARAELLAAALHRTFPAAPRQCLETLAETERIDFDGVSAYFNRNATDMQRQSLERLFDACGIRPRSSPEDYAVLGLTPDASAEEVKRVYRRLAADFHPDAASELSDDQRRMSEEAFLKIKEAYERIRH